MSYLTEGDIAADTAMQTRVAQAAAGEGLPEDPNTGRPYDPDRWTMEHRRTWAAAPGWSEAWESAETSDPDGDHGANEGVVTDGMILAQIQSML